MSKSTPTIAPIKSQNLSLGSSPSRRYEESTYKSPTGSISTRLASVTAINALIMPFAPLSERAYLCFNFSVKLIIKPLPF